MPTKLPINLQDLLCQRTVEGERIEYKTGWNPDATLRTICAFANDFANLGGGYVVIGQDCDANGQPIFPPVGLAANQFDKIQRELLAHCQLIQPPYFPVLSLEEVEGRQLIVLWAPGGQNRPYKVPAAVTAKHKVWHHYIRRYASTVQAEGEDEQEYPKGEAPPALEDLAERIRTADAFVFVTGEYNWGPQPGLKNLTDHFLEEWFWRPAAIASYSAGRFSGVRSGTIWHAILSEMGMVVVSSTLAVGPISQTLDADGRPTGNAGEQLQKAFPRFADDLAWWTEAAREQRARKLPPY